MLKIGHRGHKMLRISCRLQDVEITDAMRCWLIEAETKWPQFSRRRFQIHFLYENIWILIKISLKFVPYGPINNIPSLVQIMAWHWPGDKPLSEPAMASLLPHIGITLLQWVTDMSQGSQDVKDMSHGGHKMLRISQRGHKMSQGSQDVKDMSQGSQDVKDRSKGSQDVTGVTRC